MLAEYILIKQILTPKRLNSSVYIPKKLNKSWLKVKKKKLQKGR